MKITLTDGRAELFQWDTGVQIQVDGQCDQFHFANKLLGRSIDVDAEQGEGISSCKIPDVLLQVSQPLKVYVFIRTITGGITKLEQDFTVKGRNKPNDYVFTPAEQLTLEEIKAIAQGAEKTANSVREDADAGKFSGDVMYATFEIEPETGILKMFTSDRYAGPDFVINDNGEMEVVI